MFGFIMRRLVLLITTFGLLTVILFWVHIRLNSIDITRFIPEYLSYSSHLLRLDFGTNSETGASILEEIKLYLPHTAVLLTLSLVLALILGSILGISGGMWHRSLGDRLLRTFCRLTNSIPVYWLAQLLIIVFAVKLRLLPSTGNFNLLLDMPEDTGFLLIDVLKSGNMVYITDVLKHLILPVATIMIMPCAEITSITRKATLDVMSSNYVRAAYSHGASNFTIAIHHILTNILPSLLPHLSIIICNIFSACILVETVFEWPGLGFWLTQSVTASQNEVIEACVFVLGTGLLIINIGIEILCALFFKNNRRTTAAGEDPF